MWDGYECAPKGDLNNLLGSTVNLYEVEAHHSSSQEASDCFDQYSDYFQEGINNRGAVIISSLCKSYA